MRHRRIAIIGVGPRGLAALERVLSHATMGALTCELLLVEPAELGVGAHRRDQPDFLILNTVAGQITAFSDPEMVPGAPVVGGPTFLAWCRERRLTVPESWSSAVEEPVAAEHFLPRRIYGEYLAWVAGELLGRVPATVEISIAPEVAVDVRPTGAGATVTLRGGTTHEVDLAIVTTGHGLHPPASQNGTEKWIDRCYPLPEKVAGIRPGERVAVLGAGLTAVDVIAALTVGRGGRFWKDGAKLRYRRGGEEPELVLVSRGGWLPCARPSRPRARPPVDTGLPRGLADLRARSGGPIGFRGGLEPLLREALTQGLGPVDRRTVRRMLGLEASAWRDEGDFHAAVLEQAAFDLAEAEAGLGASLVKERLELLRDQREVLRSAVDDSGMTPVAHGEFFDVVPALANRTAVGPQRERLEELVSLIEADVVRLAPWPRPALTRDGEDWQLSSTALKRKSSVRVDTVVKAFLEFPEQDEDLDPLGTGLRDWTAPHPADERFLNLDRRGRPLAQGGTRPPGISVFGPPAEGASYYNNYILWPGSWSRVLTDLDLSLVPLLEQGLGGVGL